jgi:MFS family permease
MVLFWSFLLFNLLGYLLSNYLRTRMDLAGKLVVTVLAVYLIAFGCLAFAKSLTLPSIGGPLGVVAFCSVLRAMALPGAFSYCTELLRHSSTTLIETIFFMQLLFGGISQLVGTFITINLSYEWAFVVIAACLVVLNVPISLFLIRKMMLKVEAEEQNNL